MLQIFHAKGTRYCNNLGWLWCIADDVSYLSLKSLITANICLKDFRINYHGKGRGTKERKQENCGEKIAENW